MADQHNSNIPAMGNQISSDVPDIKENLEFHKDALQRLFETWSDSDNSAGKIDSGVGFTDGTYDYEFPTNPAIGASSVIMLGNSSTVVWMYLNAAPPGWKALATGADTVLAVSGGAAAYSGNGGTAGGSFDIATANIEAHNHTIAHTHTLGAYVADAGGGTKHSGASGALLGSPATSASSAANSGNAGGADGLYRPAASIGKLFQLDTA